MKRSKNGNSLNSEDLPDKERALRLAGFGIDDGGNASNAPLTTVAVGLMMAGRPHFRVGLASLTEMKKADELEKRTEHQRSCRRLLKNHCLNSSICLKIDEHSLDFERSRFAGITMTCSSSESVDS